MKRLFNIVIVSIILVSSVSSFERNKIGEQIEFNGKTYEYLGGNEFSYIGVPFNVDENLKFTCQFDWNEPPTPRSEDNYKTRKVLGLKNDWEYVKYTRPEKYKNYYAKDGVLHVIATRDYDSKTKTWNVCYPRAQCQDEIPFGSIVQVRFKLGHRGKGWMYQTGLDSLGDGPEFTKPNEKGYIFSSFFGFEMLSGYQNHIEGGLGTWFTGKVVERGTASKKWANDIAPGEWTGNVEYDNPANQLWGKYKAYGFDWDDKEFNEWHILTIKFDEDGYYTWIDDIRTSWYDWNLTGEPDESAKVRKLTISSNSAQDWLVLGMTPNGKIMYDKNGNPIYGSNSKNVGDVDLNENTNDFQIDYIRIYKKVENKKSKK